MLVEITEKEKRIIEELRKRPKYSKITIEKRPTKENKEGEPVRVVVEESILI